MTSDNEASKCCGAQLFGATFGHVASPQPFPDASPLFPFACFLYFSASGQSQLTKIDEVARLVGSSISLSVASKPSKMNIYKMEFFRKLTY